ncbi:MAG: ParB/RepB/Spo0J family partition protein [Armatimonadota bacterium]
MGLEHLPLEDVRPAANQPRRTFYEESLRELATSIRERGVLEPIVVRPAPEDPGRYEIIMGERHWRACCLAGMGSIPAIVRDVGDDDVAVDSLLENFQREDLNPIEKAHAIKGLLQVYPLDKAARALGVSETTIRRALDLLELPEAIQIELVVRPGAGQPAFNETHARLLLPLASDPKLQKALVEKVKSERLSTAALEKVIQAIAKYPAKKGIFLKVAVGVAEQMIRSLDARAERTKPYKPQTARDHLRSIDRQATGLADVLDARLAEHLTSEEMNHLLAAMTLLARQIDAFSGEVRKELEARDASFREVYLHCPLCGRIELVGALRCSVCWSVLRRCVDCGRYDAEAGRCTVRNVDIDSDDAEAPGDTSESYRCDDYVPRHAPGRVGLPMAPAGGAEPPRTGMMRRF